MSSDWRRELLVRLRSCNLHPAALSPEQRDTLVALLLLLAEGNEASICVGAAEAFIHLDDINRALDVQDAQGASVSPHAAR